MLLQASASTSINGVSDRILRSSMSCPHAFSSRTDSSLRILQRVKLWMMVRQTCLHVAGSRLISCLSFRDLCSMNVAVSAVLGGMASS